MLAFTEVQPRISGLLPSFLSADDPRPAKDQIHENYAHGGGWHSFKGFVATFDQSNPLKSFLQYPEDPPMKALAFALFRSELIVLFEGSWVGVCGPDGDYDISRMD